MALPLPNTTEVQITRLTKALFSAAPGNTYLTAFAESAGTTTAGMTTFANWLTGYVSADAATLATTVVANIGLTGAAATAGTAYLTQQFAANAGNYGRVILDAMNALSTIPASDATYGAAASAFNDSIATSYAYSIDATHTSTNLNTLMTADEPSAVTGQTFTLTTSADNKVGTSGDDTFDGSLSGTSMTFGSADTINGGAGTDTMTVAMNAALTYQAASLTNVETINVIDSAGATLSLAGATGVTSVMSMGSTTATTVSNIASTSVALGVTNSAVGATFTFAAAAVAGTTDTATLTLAGQTAGTDVIAGVETLNIVSSGAANAVTALTTAAATKYVITGDQTLSLGTLGTTVLTVDASAATAGVTFTSDQATASTITGASGNDAITMTGTNAVNDSIDAGAGNDTITFAANLANTDTVDGGAGTDTLVMTTALATGYTAPATATITNFETLKLSNALAGGLTTATIQAGITTLNLNAGSGAQAVVMDAGAQTIKIGASNTGSLTVTDTGTATTDTLTVANNAAATDMFNAAGGLIVNGYETVTINGSGTGAATSQDATVITLTADTGGTSTLNLVGSNTFTTAGSITAAVIDASGLTGSAKLTMGAAATTVTSITGGANNDTLVGDASSNINGGAGDDTVTGGANNDTLAGGAGNDSITTDAGNDSISGGAGNDTLVLAGNLATGDVVDGGDGTDTLSIVNASLTTINAYSISTITSLNNAISNMEAVTVSDALNQATFDMARLDSLSAINLALGYTGAEALQGMAAGSTVTLGEGDTGGAAALTLTYADATGSADALTVVLMDQDGTASAEDYDQITIASIESLTLQSAEATASTTVYVQTLDVSATGLTTLTLAGTESFNLSGIAINATTINASGVADATAGSVPTVNILGGSAAQSITGSGGADTINGGAGADTILGGAGADTITAGTGIDVITAGTGADTIDGGSGNDSIDLTEATAAVDHVELAYSEAGAYKDTVTGFTKGTGGDIVDFDLSALVLAGTSGIHSATTDFVLLGAGATSIGAGTASSYEEITTATTAAAGSTIFGIVGTIIADTSELEDVLELGGSFALTTNGAVDAADAFMVFYSDGINGHIAAIRTIAGDTGAGNTFNSGDLVAKDLVILAGVTSIAAGDFVSANFDYIV